MITEQYRRVYRTRAENGLEMVRTKRKGSYCERVGKPEEITCVME